MTYETHNHLGRRLAFGAVSSALLISAWTGASGASQTSGEPLRPTSASFTTVGQDADRHMWIPWTHGAKAVLAAKVACEDSMYPDDPCVIDWDYGAD